jgi:L-alanine-DL-glutamate epimerase-like enolase superfamily enzyme
MTKTNNPKVIKSKNQNYSSSIQEWVEMGQVWKEHLEELEKENEDLKSSKGFYESRCELLQKVQKYMRDPERTIVCDILAINSLLPDPFGERYGQDLWKLIYQKK